MNKIVHLDCSLRDGGYYNNWDFSPKLINDYLNVLGAIKVDYCEVGFRFFKNSGFKGSCAFTSEEFLKSLEIPENLKIAIMINGNEFINNNKLDLEKIRKVVPVLAKDSKVTLVRVACHSESINKILPLFEFLDDYGYETACNITQVSEKTNDEIDEISQVLASSKVKIIYFADSLGSLEPAQISKIIKSIRKNWSGPIGIHAHDNKGLALSNTLEAIKCGIEWIDSTITGIGRGPGNTKTEELVIELSNLKKEV